jgi:hypothetical protein
MNWRDFTRKWFFDRIYRIHRIGGDLGEVQEFLTSGLVRLVGSD